MNEFFTEQEQIDLAKASELEAQIQTLGDETDKLLEPICQRILSLPIDKLKEILPHVIQDFPRGFHRSELRSVMSQLGIK